MSNQHEAIFEHQNTTYLEQSKQHESKIRQFSGHVDEYIVDIAMRDFVTRQMLLQEPNLTLEEFVTKVKLLWPTKTVPSLQESLSDPSPSKILSVLDNISSSELYHSMISALLLKDASNAEILRVRLLKYVLEHDLQNQSSPEPKNHWAYQLLKTASPIELERLCLEEPMGIIDWRALRLDTVQT